MTLQEAIKELEYFQKWRKGADIEQPSPRRVSEALDAAINLLKKLK